MKPTISIVIPLYNKEQYIAETIRSVVKQSEQDWELLVVDNGSTDGSREVVRRMDDPRIRLLSCARRGASAARNDGFAQAAGEWLVFLDADDLLAVDYLRSQLAHSQDADMVLCSYVEFADTDGERRIKSLWHGQPSQAAILDAAVVFAPGPTHSFLLRRTLMRPGLEWPEHLDRLLGEDATFWFRLINEARLGYNEQSVALYRFLTANGRFSTLSNPADLFNGLHAAIEENLGYLKGRGQTASYGQAENLMRFYGDVYVQARRQRDVGTTVRALEEARRWQDCYFQTSPRPSRPMQVRRWLGLPLFARLIGHA